MTVKALVLSGYGQNCDIETAYAFDLAGASSERVHINTIIENPKIIDNFYNSLEFSKEEIFSQADIKIKYKGYIDRERLVVDKIERLENVRISDDFEYSKLQSLSTEARQKLNKIKPKTIGQASRIPGVSPSDINVLLVFLGR